MQFIDTAYENGFAALIHGCSHLGGNLLLVASGTGNQMSMYLQGLQLVFKLGTGDFLWMLQKSIKIVFLFICHKLALMHFLFILVQCRSGVRLSTRVLGLLSLFCRLQKHKALNFVEYGLISSSLTRTPDSSNHFSCRTTFKVGKNENGKS